MTMMHWDPFREALSVRQVMDRLLEEAVIRPRGGEEGSRSGGLVLPLDVKEHEDELVVRASLPGVRPEDVDITFEESVLTIQGELRDDDEDEDEDGAGQQTRRGAQATAQQEERERNQPTNGQRGEDRQRTEGPNSEGHCGRQRGPGHYHQRERVYGRFFRQVRLPMPVNADQAEATFEHGVLPVTLPKAEQARRRRIEVTSEGGRQQLASGESSKGTPGAGESGTAARATSERAPKQGSR